MTEAEICGWIINLIDRNVVSTRQELIELRPDRPDLDFGKALDVLIKDDYMAENQGKLELSVRSHSVLAAGQLFLQTSPSGQKLTNYLESLKCKKKEN